MGRRFSFAKISGALVALLFLFFVFGFGYQGQVPITGVQAATSGVLVLPRYLSIGTSGSDVRDLQLFLKSTGDFTYPVATGYFGPGTQLAVRRFQARNKIVSYGTPWTTGYGRVGPRTKQALVSLSVSLAAPQPAQSPQPLQPGVSPMPRSSPSGPAATIDQSSLYAAPRTTVKITGTSTGTNILNIAVSYPNNDAIYNTIAVTPGKSWAVTYPSGFNAGAYGVTVRATSSVGAVLATGVLLVQGSLPITPTITPTTIPTSTPVPTFSPSPSLISGPLSCDTNKSVLVPMFELFNGRTGQHLYTTSVSEKNSKISVDGYSDRGAMAYIYSQQVAGTVPLQKFKKSGSDDRIYEVNPNVAQLNARGYYFEKTEGYVYADKKDKSFPFEMFSNSKSAEHYYTVSVARPILEALGYVYEGSRGYACKGRPSISDNTILAFADKTMTIKGADFGSNPRSSEYKIVFSKGASTITVASNDSRVISWEGNSIKINTPPGVTSSYQVRVVAGEYGSSDLVPLRVYRYVSHSSVSPENIYGNPHPLDIAMDSSSKLWIVSEFSRGVESYDPAANKNTYYKDVQPEGRSDISEFGEDVDVARNGDIWYTLGGPGYGQQGGYGRIIQLTPSTGKQRCYTVPIAGPGLIGIYLDEERETVWAGAENLSTDVHPNFLMSFKPKTFSASDASCTYNYTVSYPINFCSGNETDRCFKKYDMVYKVFPWAWIGYGVTHLEKGPDGNIWFTDFYGTSIGMFDVAAQKTTIFPLPPTLRTSGAIGSGPWQLKFDSLGNLWVNEYFESHFIKFDIRAKDRLNCTELDGSKKNPCVKEYDIIYFPLSSWEKDQVHTIDIDSSDRVWFTTGGAVDAAVGFLGMVDPAGEIQLSPPLTDLGIKGGGGGTVVDNRTGDIWFNEFWNKKLAQLKYLP